MKKLLLLVSLLVAISLPIQAQEVVIECNNDFTGKILDVETLKYDEDKTKNTYTKFVFNVGDSKGMLHWEDVETKEIESIPVIVLFSQDPLFGYRIVSFVQPISSTGGVNVYTYSFKEKTLVQMKTNNILGKGYAYITSTSDCISIFDD